jgi:hypothetical protein
MSEQAETPIVRTLPELVELVANQRNEVAGLRAKQAEAIEALALTPESQKLIEIEAQLRAANEGVNNLETELRTQALEAYHQSNNKTPVAGVTIKLFTAVTYVMADALAWCMSNAPTLVRAVLDVKSFEKIADKLPGAPVTVEQTPKAYIASDLSK